MPTALRFSLSLLVVGTAYAQTGLPLAELHLGIQRIQVEVASTPATQAIGLMHRKTLPEHRGMLFVHDGSRKLCMWMKNTFIPLSVAFIDNQGRILNIEDMQPDSRDLHCSAHPAQYALEMRLGWFRDNGIKGSDKVVGLEYLQGIKNNQQTGP